MRRLPALLLLLLVSCPAPDGFEVVDRQLVFDRASARFDLTHSLHSDALTGLSLASGRGDATIEMQFGSYRFSDETLDMTEARRILEATQSRDDGSVSLALADEAEAALGTLRLGADPDSGALRLSFVPEDTGANRFVLEGDCDPEDHFLGFGGHAFDVDHVGQAFGLWVGEPGIGKVDTEEYPDDWFLTGTRHATSYPVPFLLRPHQSHGLLFDTDARVEVDLCASDPARWSVTVWEGAGEVLVLSGADAGAVVGQLMRHEGLTSALPPAPPPDWALGPWNDAIRGSENVRAIAERIRAIGAPSSVIWSEDWRGAEDNGTGYRLSEEWGLDRSIYPDAEQLAADLRADGFAWFAYFAPFLKPDTQSWEDALEADVLLKNADGEPYLFNGITFAPTGMVDLSFPAGQDFVRRHLQDAIDIGFAGWMTDFAEWLPTDAVLASGEDALLAHNAYPAAWQTLHREIIDQNDATMFVRSGWRGATALSPIVWAGDQRTSFDTDDGFPTVLPLGLGLAASGIRIFTHDVAGYQSIGNDPSDRELWWRWAWLGAFSPILRTHHGAFEADNWRFDSDSETEQLWVDVTRTHTALLPYRRGLMERAFSDDPRPMIQPTGFVYPGEDWGRLDAWLLGDHMLVAPVLERGATGREVQLPDGVRWFDYFTGEPVQSGWFDAAPDEIPVFVAEGAVLPHYETIPDTLLSLDGGDLLDIDDAEQSRRIVIYGAGSDFEEGGIRYQVSGSPTGAGETRGRFQNGEISVAGLTVRIESDRERDWIVQVIP